MGATNNHNDEIYQLIAKELDGSIMLDEQAQLKKWCSMSSDNQREYDKVVKLWEATSSEFTAESLPGFNEEAAWKSVREKLEVRQTSNFRYKGNNWLWAVAASLLLLISVTGILFLRENTVTVVATSGKTPHVLPDSSVITLKLHSTIMFDEGLNGNLREVELIGDAFFEVLEDKEKPFIVHAGELEIRVLGTSFHVSQDSLMNATIVKVATGTVSVKSEDTQNEDMILSAGESVVYDLETKKFSRRDINDNEFFWYSNVLRFNEKRLKDVIETINRNFKSNIVLDSPGLGRCRITTTFENQSLEEILRIIQLTLGLSVDYGNDEIRLVGDGC